MVEGASAALSVYVYATVLAPEALHLQSPQKVVADDAPCRVDVGQRLRVCVHICMQ